MEETAVQHNYNISIDVGRINNILIDLLVFLSCSSQLSVKDMMMAQPARTWMRNLRERREKRDLKQKTHDSIISDVGQKMREDSMDKVKGECRERKKNTKGI